MPAVDEDGGALRHLAPVTAGTEASGLEENGMSRSNGPEKGRCFKSF
jgi:hypothetical protein